MYEFETLRQIVQVVTCLIIVEETEGLKTFVHFTPNQGFSESQYKNGKENLNVLNFPLEIVIGFIIIAVLVRHKTACFRRTVKNKIQKLKLFLDSGKGFKKE